MFVQPGLCPGPDGELTVLSQISSWIRIWGEKIGKGRKRKGQGKDGKGQVKNGKEGKKTAEGKGKVKNKNNNKKT